MGSLGRGKDGSAQRFRQAVIYGPRERKLRPRRERERHALFLRPDRSSQSVRRRPFVEIPSLSAILLVVAAVDAEDCFPCFKRSAFRAGPTDCGPLATGTSGGACGPQVADRGHMAKLNLSRQWLVGLCAKTAGLQGQQRWVALFCRLKPSGCGW
jgi:hypothetical protein